MNILITGAAGFLGADMARAALEGGHSIRALIRPGGERERVDLPEDRIFALDLGQPVDLTPAVEGIDAVIHCAAITSTGVPDEDLSRRVNVEGTRRLLEAARAAGARRWVQISSMSAHPASTSVYGRTKLAADEVLRSSTPPPEWTILRPSLIYGPGGRGLVDKTVALMRKLPVLPVIGSGRERIRPVYVRDVSRAALTCLEAENVSGKTYMLGGADEMTLNAFMTRLSRAAGPRRRLVHLPVWMCLILAKLLAFVVKAPPITVDNVLGVREAMRVDHSAAQTDWGYRPIGLEQGLERTFKSP